MPGSRVNAIRRVAKQLTKRHLRNLSYPSKGPSGIRSLVHQEFVLSGVNMNKSEVNRALPNIWFENTNFHN